MKKFFAFPLLCCLLALGSCSDSDTPTPDDGLPAGYVAATENTALQQGRITDDMLFFGRSTVRTIGSDETFTDSKALFELTPEGSGTARLLMHETRFAATMPALEMELPALACTGSERTLDLTAATLIPEIKGTPYERYAITALSGRVEETVFRVTFTCAGRFDVTYEGVLIVRK
ncbi:MAG: hypothetical protein K2H69_04315 [Alistipes sp.]|nr:hypothetical protein [Alistipes sp.]